MTLGRGHEAVLQADGVVVLLIEYGHGLKAQDVLGIFGQKGGLEVVSVAVAEEPGLAGSLLALSAR